MSLKPPIFAGFRKKSPKQKSVQTGLHWRFSWFDHQTIELLQKIMKHQSFKAHPCPKDTNKLKEHDFAIQEIQFFLRDEQTEGLAIFI